MIESIRRIILCRFGLHKWQLEIDGTPNIYRLIQRCVLCGKAKP